MNTGFNIAGQDISDFLIPRDPFTEGTLWVWGNNVFGSLGVNNASASDYHRSSPVQTVSGGTNWRQAVVGGTSGGIKTDGTLWMWGEGENGKHGTNVLTNLSSPVQTVAGDTNWKQLAIGYTAVSAIKTDGTLWVWGSNSNGFLGTGDTVHRSSPVQTVAYGTNWKQVSIGINHISAVKTDGTLWIWGFNYAGSLGTNDLVHRSSPVQTVAGGTNWKQTAAGSYFNAAIKTDGTLWTWGHNLSGNLGLNNIAHRSSPVQTVAYGTNWKQVAVSRYTGGSNFSVISAVKTDGTLWLWGDNNSGNLGTNDTTMRSSPVQTISYGNNWKQVSVEAFITGAVKTDGTLWMWGTASDGLLGTNDGIARSSPVQTIVYGTNWKSVTINDGRFNSNRAVAAIKDDGLYF